MKDEEIKKHTWQQWVCFRLGTEEFGVDILKVREIVRIQSITHVPQTPDTVAGVINLRGNVIPVIDLPKKLGLPEAERDDKARIIVFFIEDKLIGMIVDRVERVLRIQENQIEPPPDIGVGRLQEYIKGMGKTGNNLTILLNIEKILTEEEIIQMEDLKKIKQASTQKKEAVAEPPKKVQKPVTPKPSPAVQKKIVKKKTLKSKPERRS
jgi:purine-binding chemotaxis protein CheW